jgi:hypothetical protein
MTQQHPAEIRPYQPGDASQVLALAPRLTEWVAAWREPGAVLRAAQDWLTGSLGHASQPGHMVYLAVSGDGVVGVVTVGERAHFSGQLDAYVGEAAPPRNQAAPGQRIGWRRGGMHSIGTGEERCGGGLADVRDGDSGRIRRGQRGG